MTNLGQPNAAYAGDRGDPDAAVRESLHRAAAAGPDEATSYLRAVAALCGARLLLPLVAIGDDRPDQGGDGARAGDLAAAMVTSAGGATGLLGFTGLDALRAWNPAARPVPCTLDELAVTARESGCQAVLVDLAGPAPLVIEAGLVAELAAGRRLVEFVDGGWGWAFRAPDSSISAPTS